MNPMIWGYSINLNDFFGPWTQVFSIHPHRQVSKTLDEQDVTYSLVCDTWRNNKKARTRKKLYTLVMIGDYKFGTLQYTKELMDDYEIEIDRIV